MYGITGWQVENLHEELKDTLLGRSLENCVNTLNSIKNNLVVFDEESGKLKKVKRVSLEDGKFQFTIGD